MTESRKPILLAVGGLDPSGCAGILADTRVWNFYSLPCRAVVTAVTAQNERNFLSWKPVDLGMFHNQLQAVAGRILGVKLGMLATREHLQILLKFLRKLRPRWILWDPVLRASTGKKLFRISPKDPLLQKMLGITDVFTPNLPEAEWFLVRRVSDSHEMKAAVFALSKGMKSESTLVLKGGHFFAGEASEKAIDWVLSKKKLSRLTATRRAGDPRGTGCAFGAALLAALAQGKDPLSAARSAKRYVLHHLF